MTGQSWLDAGASFVGMWTVMMVAMMLPALVPTLAHYRARLRGAGAIRSGGLSGVVGLAYFAVWTLIGIGVFAAGAALVGAELWRPAVARVVPAAAGIVVLSAGLVQLTPWKARQLACQRADARAAALVPLRVRDALSYGLRVGIRCALCCAGLMAVQVALGVMDLRAMAAVAAAINLERLAPAGTRVARATGVIAMIGGLVLIARATGSLS